MARELHEGKVVFTERLGSESYPYAPNVHQNTPPPPDKLSAEAATTHADWMAHASSRRGRGCPRAPPIRLLAPLPPVEFEAHGDIPVAVVVQSTTTDSPTLGAVLLTVYAHLQLP